jgi:hypothetical protein
MPAGDAVLQGRDHAVNEALLRVRRLLRSELQSVMAVSESLEGQDGGFSGLQALQLLQHEQLLPGEQLPVRQGVLCRQTRMQSAGYA